MAVDYYAVLSVAPGASPADIKAAYHRALLAVHPDKNPGSPNPDIAAIQEAYRVLSSPSLRAQHAQHTPAGPRPAQVISLADFDEEQDDKWTHACRCGGAYAITGAEMEGGLHLVPCTSCSEVVWVGYEMVEEG
ncbi:DnaJ-domain-containing protein [Mycena leptocephala]|nr:DnaJ-domain-containing protein [Mycena leptocephala]